MWENIAASAGQGVAWLVTSCLLVAGAAGCVIPILPGHLIIIVAAVAHRLMLGPESGLHWWSFLVLGLLAALSQTFETLSGAAGAKWFGGTKWGAFGALAGSIAGLFFMPFGLLLGPLAGAILFEMVFAKRQTKPAVSSGMGSVVGTLAGMGIKIVIGVLMIAWFFLDVFVIR
ncbi:MAG: DUF456 domain-containing protein [Verrucomicrobiota bacterium]